MQEFRQRIADGAYYLTGHVRREMRLDGLERPDVENAIFKGWIDRKLTDDPRGTRYVLAGPAVDQRLIHSVLRLDQEGRLRIITVYAL